MNRRSWLLVLPAVLVLGFAVVAVYSFVRPVEFRSTAYDPPAAAPDFRLTDHTGAELRLSELRGRPVLLFFGFTHCPDVCPLTLANLRRTMDEIGAGPDEMRVVLVSVDPERDTPEVLARYVERFGPGISGVTGDAETIRAVAAAYGVHSQAAAPGDPHGGMMHTSAVFGIDRFGRLRVLLHATDPEAPLAHDLRELLRI